MKNMNEMLSLHHLESFYCNIHEFKFQGVDSNKVELKCKKHHKAMIQTHINLKKFAQLF